MDNLKIGLLYISLYNQLVKRKGIDRTISRKEFFCIVGKHFLIPKNLRPVVIKEMEHRGLIEEKSNRDIIVLDNDIDIEKDVNELYRMVGLF